MKIDFKKIKFLVGLFIVCSFVGIGIDLVKGKSIGFNYKSKEARLDAAVENIQSLDKPSSAPVKLNEFVSLDQVKLFIQQKQGLLLDTRPEIFHRIGHIPTAISFPREDFENAYKQYKDRLESDKAIPIIVYCTGGSCEDSEMVHKALKKIGFTNVAVFKGGWDEWTRNDLQQEK